MKNVFTHRLKKAAALSLCAALLLTAGCGQPAGPKLDPKKPVTIEIWHYYNGPQQSAFDTLVSDFNESEGLKKGVFVESVSQGNVGQLTSTVLDAAQNKVGSDALPAIFAAYADNAFAMDELGLVANLDDYLTQDELKLYIPGYLDEGRFDSKGSLKIFPVAKSTEIMLLNQTDWDKFSTATGADKTALTTMEGVTATAKAYYEWTDSLTPTPGDGKAFFGRDSMANYMLIGARQLGDELFSVKEGSGTPNLDPAVMRRLWDNFYIPYINGYFTSFGRFRSDDVKTGDIIAMVGSTSGAAYFPTQVIDADNLSYDIDMLALPAPHFKDSEPYAVQQGAGMVVAKSDPQTELAAVTFLKWFTGEVHNVKFALLSGYLPVTIEGATTQSLDNFLATDGIEDISEQLIKALPVAFETCRTNTMYTNRAFKGGTEVRAILESTLLTKANTDRKALSSSTDANAAAELLAKYSSDEYFDEWLSELKSQIDSTLAKAVA